jgi:hypothetical protein
MRDEDVLCGGEGAGGRRLRAKQATRRGGARRGRDALPSVRIGRHFVPSAPALRRPSYGYET